MRRNILIITLLFLGSSKVILSQNFSKVTTCDSTYSGYKSQKKKVSKIYKKISQSKLYSNHLQKEINNAIKNEDYQKLESITYFILNEKWCKETEKIAMRLIKLDIPQLNSWILSQATSNLIDIDISRMSKICYNNEPPIPIQKSKNILIDEEDDVWVAHKALLISQIWGKDILSKINKLEQSENIFARFTLAQISQFFGNYKNSNRILENIIKEEINHLKNDLPKSKNYVYAVWSIQLLKQNNPEKFNFYFNELNSLYSISIKIYKEINNKSAEEINHENSLRRVYHLLTSDVTNCQ